MTTCKTEFETFTESTHHTEVVAESAYYSIMAEYPNYDEEGRNYVEIWHYPYDDEGKAKLAKRAKKFFASADIYPDLSVYARLVIGDYSRNLINF